MDEASSLTDQAAEIGRDHARSAASWCFDGNTSSDAIERVLRGIEDGDPEILDSLPTHGMSGEWADSYMEPDLLTDLGLDSELEPEEASDLVAAYCDAFDAEIASAVEAEARRWLR